MSKLIVINNCGECPKRDEVIYNRKITYCSLLYSACDFIKDDHVAVIAVKDFDKLKPECPLVDQGR